MATDTELSRIAPTPTPVVVGGREILVAPFKVRQIQPVLAALGPALRDGLTHGFADVMDWLLFFESHTDRVVEAVAAATDQPRAFLAELEPRELMELAFVVVEVNRDFFTRQVTPAIKRLEETLRKVGVSDGSTSLSPPDTDPGKSPS